MLEHRLVFDPRAFAGVIRAIRRCEDADVVTQPADANLIRLAELLDDAVVRDGLADDAPSAWAIVPPNGFFGGGTRCYCLGNGLFGN
jgi:hypothetical protein